MPSSNRPYSRADRLGDEVKHILGELFITHVHLHGVGMLTITKVKMTKDLMIAKVYVSFLDKEKTAEDLIRQLKDQKGVIRYNLGNRINSKFVPDLRFYYDDTLAHAEHIETLIHKLKAENTDK
jgi:ribosome-binding factor A